MIVKNQVCAFKGKLLVEAITHPITLDEAWQLPSWFWDHRPGLEIRWGTIVLPRPDRAWAIVDPRAIVSAG